MAFTFHILCVLSQMNRLNKCYGICILLKILHLIPNGTQIAFCKPSRKCQSILWKMYFSAKFTLYHFALLNFSLSYIFKLKLMLGVDLTLSSKDLRSTEVK